MTPAVVVVTRYGGHRHLADSGLPSSARHFTLCHGTSSWTLESWAHTPDHPLGLTVEAMRALPLCERCRERAPMAARLAEAEPTPLEPRPLTADIAREHIGAGVVYAPTHGPREDGVITSVGSGPAGMVFVRYGSDTGSKATRAADLILLAQPKKGGQP